MLIPNPSHIISLRALVLALLALLASVSPAFARKVSVEVADSVTGEGVPYVAVYVVGTGQGALTDDRGKVVLNIHSPEALLEFSVMGYDKIQAPLASGQSRIAVALSPSGHRLDEVVVRRGKEKYSKKNNPAVAFAERLRKAGPLTDPRRNPRFNYRKYERITYGLNDVSFGADAVPEGGKKGRFDFMREHVDTSDVTGKRIVPMAIKEKLSEVLYRRDPESSKEYRLGVRQQGIDEAFDAANLQTLLDDAFREIDLYQNDVAILRNRFVSPLSSIAPDFYKFYLTDTVFLPDSIRCVELSFAPHNPATFGFTGRLLVEDDSTMFVRRAIMNVPPSINLNFIDFLQIIQTFDKAPDGSRLKTLDDFYVEMSVMPGTPSVFARRLAAYDEFSFGGTPHDEILDELGAEYSDPFVYSRDDAFWDEMRLVGTSRGEDRVGLMMQSLRRWPLFYWGEKFVNRLFQGYVPIGKNSKFDIGPINTFISHNSLEGWRPRFGGMTTAALSPHWFLQGYLAYGIDDRRFKYGAEVEYSFNKKRQHPKEFPIHSIKLSEKYDLDRLGANLVDGNQDNFFNSFGRGTNKLMTYRRQTRLDYTIELDNHLSFNAGFNFERQETSPWVPFTLGDGSSIRHYDEACLSFGVRYAPGEKFLERPKGRLSIGNDRIVLELNHLYAPKGLLGSRFTVNRTEFSVYRRIWLSAFGFIDAKVGAGHLWSRAPYPNLPLANSSQSYIIHSQTFTLMDPMEFVADTYAEWFISYQARGAIFNYIPLLKKLKLREVFCFRGWWGALSDNNRPWLHPELFAFPRHARSKILEGAPYMEVSVGIDNIFRILRVDYVWRVSQRRGVPASMRSGLRLGLHVTF